jgi:hypothetical protein
VLRLCAHKPKKEAVVSCSLFAVIGWWWVVGAYGYSLPLLRARHVALLLLLFRIPRRATEKVRCPMVFPASLPSGDNEGALSAFLPNGAAPDTVLRRCGTESSASSSYVVRRTTTTAAAAAAATTNNQQPTTKTKKTGEASATVGNTEGG